MIMSTTGKKEKDRKRRKGEGETSNKKFEKKKRIQPKSYALRLSCYIHTISNTPPHRLFSG